MPEDIQIKKQLLRACETELLQQRINVQKRLEDIVSGLQSETKSTAGDKHETGRAMLHIERENVGRQLAEIEKQEQVLKRIQLDKQEHIALGSVVYTENSNYFIAVPIGKLVIDAVDYYAIGTSSPIGQLLLGKKQGETLQFRTINDTIISHY